MPLVKPVNATLICQKVLASTKMGLLIVSAVSGCLLEDSPSWSKMGPIVVFCNLGNQNMNFGLPIACGVGQHS